MELPVDPSAQFIKSILPPINWRRNDNLYGVTGQGGTAGFGVIFEISTNSSTYTILHNFGDGSVANDGKDPVGPLVVGKDKNLYGTTTAGGSAGLGTVFKITP
jgi:uncharacterized repeat protein (TIGR03803 family)